MGFLSFFRRAAKEDKPSAPAPADQLRSPALILQEIDDIYVLIRGALYANGLNEAKTAFHDRNFVDAFKHVRETGELYRRTHLQTIKQDPAKTGGGKKEIQKLRDKQAKIKDVLARFEAVVVQLEKMAKLQPDKAKPAARTVPKSAAQLPPEASADRPADPNAQQKELAAHIIDAGSFTHLQTAAQQTGLLPMADGIGFVRDHEFRMGKYQEAFERIYAYFLHLKNAAEQRQRTLRQEERDYKSGILKMSPKQWLIKQQTDAAQTQKTERTLRYFTRMLDGLRIMIASNANTPPPDATGPSQ
jgi:hypothetical protein